ncbi:MAG: succinylglutamate desuccinylase/aspartoacylase family protein [Nanoarchaeota archaeon]|nr:succinylglutamate desuccinylase/aspartoacylase family protein [Nanoarchaeota archaeon]
MKNLAIVCCLHGNERYGFEVSKNQSFFHFFLSNKKAFIENKRCIDADLNRCFPGKIDGNHEERLAYNLIKKIKDFYYIIDLHSCSNNCPMFGIITKPNPEKIEFAKQLGLKKLIIMPEFFASGKALIDFVDCGISIEVGPHNRKENVREAIQLIKNIIENKINEDIDIYEAFNIIKKSKENILINNFENITKGQIIASDISGNQSAEYDFTAVLVGEDVYEGVLCLACRRII